MLIKESPDYTGGAKLFLSQNGILICIGRSYDTTYPGTSENEIIAREKQRSNGRNDSLFYIEKVNVGNVACLKTEHIDYMSSSYDDEENFYCPANGFGLSINYNRHAVRTVLKCHETIKRILTSFKIDGKGTLSYIYITNDDKCRNCKDTSFFSGWRIYNNKESGVSLKYPAIWQITPEDHYSENLIEIHAVGLTIHISKPADSSARSRFPKLAQSFQKTYLKIPSYKKRVINFAGDSCSAMSYIENQKYHTIKHEELWGLRSGLHASIHWTHYYSYRDSIASPFIDTILSSVSLEKGISK
jgi:hypothetical protein